MRQTVRDLQVVVVGVRPAGRARNSAWRAAEATSSCSWTTTPSSARSECSSVWSGRCNAGHRGRRDIQDPAGIQHRLPAPVAFEVPRWEFPILEESLESNPPLDRYGSSAATTTCCLSRRSAFEAVGGFDKRLTTGENPELFHRLRKAGYRFIVPGRAWTHHAPPADIRRFLPNAFSTARDIPRRHGSIQLAG